MRSLYNVRDRTFKGYVLVDSLLQYLPYALLTYGFNANPTASKNLVWSVPPKTALIDRALFLLGYSNGGDERRHSQHNATLHGGGAFGASRCHGARHRYAYGQTATYRLGSMALDCPLCID